MQNSENVKVVYKIKINAENINDRRCCHRQKVCHVHPLVVVHAPASCGRGLEGDGRFDSTIDEPSSIKTLKLVGDRFKRFSMEYIRK